MLTYNDTSAAFVGEGGNAALSGFGVAVRLDDGERELQLAAQEQHQGADARGEYTDYIRIYQDEAETPEVVVRLKLRSYGRFIAAFVEGRVVRDNDFGHHRAFAPDNAIVLKLAQPDGVQAAMANYQHKDWWTRPHFGADFTKLPNRTVSLLWQADGVYYHLLPATGPQYRSDAAGGEREAGALRICVSSHLGGMTSCDALAFVLGAGADPYALAESNAELALALLGDPVLPRSRKAYPERLDYLGWCSWDAFYHQVDEAGLLAKADELRRSGLPVKWIMIDDGWSQVADRKLQAFDADPDKFPQGLARTIRELKEHYGVQWVGVWHTIVGYWNGIHPDSELAEELSDYLFATHRGNVIPYPDAAKGFGFWNAWHGYLKRQGVDFVKVDSQSAVNNFLRHHRSVGASASAAHTALEASVALHFDHTIINCMGMAAENVWHRPVSAVSRNSDDFVPQERHGFREHALQNAYNSYYHGVFYWGDWDMFWTMNHDDIQNAVLRAVSGGPVYCSDAPGKTDPSRLWPLVYSDGRIIRCDRPANPTPDCLTLSPLDSGRPLKLWNTSGRTGVVAAFHIGENNEALQGSVSAADVPGLPASGDGRIVVFDYFAGTVQTIGSQESVVFELQPEQCALFTLVPSAGSSAVTPIGLANKYVSAHAVLEHRVTADGTTVVRLVEGGRFAFVADRKPVSVRVNGKDAEWTAKPGGLYEVECGGAHGEVVVEIALG